MTITTTQQKQSPHFMKFNNDQLNETTLTTPFGIRGISLVSHKAHKALLDSYKPCRT